MLDTMKNQRIDIPEVVEKFGVAPELVGDVLALMGDSVDNVPGHLRHRPEDRLEADPGLRLADKARSTPRRR